MKYPVYYNKNNDTYFMVTNADDDNVILFENKTRTVLYRLACNKFTCSHCKVHHYMVTHFDEDDEMCCQDIIVFHPELLAESFPNIVYCGSCEFEEFDDFVIRYKEEINKPTKHEKDEFNMKFRNSDGEVFSDIKSAYYAYCKKTQYCDECNVAAHLYDGCDDFVFRHPKRAAELMGYEIVDEVKETKNDIPDYKKRMQTEYRELKERYDKLHNMIVKYEAGTLDFEPNCTIDILKNQKSAMGQYLYWLEVRAQIENVEL